MPKGVEETPAALGTEYINHENEKELFVRLDSAKMKKLPAKLDREKTKEAQAVASIIGKTLYRHQLCSRPQTRSAKSIRLLSRLGKWVAGDTKRWRDPTFGGTLTEAEWIWRRI